MTDLERRALLGCRDAQEECTRRGIVLLCPFCGDSAELTVKNGLYSVACKDGTCIASDIHPEYGEAMVALADWNTRQAPPIGRCLECAEYDTSGCPDGCGWCQEWNVGKSDEGFCDKFKEKGTINDDTRNQIQR